MEANANQRKKAMRWMCVKGNRKERITGMTRSEQNTVIMFATV